MPIQQVTKLNTGAIMPLIGLGIRHVMFERGHELMTLLPLDPLRNVEVAAGAGRACRRDRSQERLQTHRHGGGVWLVLQLFGVYF